MNGSEFNSIVQDSTEDSGQVVTDIKFDDGYRRAAQETFKDDYGFVLQAAAESDAPPGECAVRRSHNNLAEGGGVRCGTYVASSALSGGVADSEHNQTALSSGENIVLSANDTTTAQPMEIPRENAGEW